MATFRCKRSGNTVSFSIPSDIEGMRKHEGYEEVIENGAIEKATEVHAESPVDNPNERESHGEERKDDAGNEEEEKVLKKRGRKPKN